MSLDNLPVEWLKSSFANLNDYRANNFNPLKNDETYYELYSVPIFPQGYPEILQANEIGSSKQIVEKNDVLLCKINPRINRVWQVSKYTDYLNIASSEWIVFRQCNVVPNFYRYYFQSLEFRNLLCANVSGVGGSLTRAQPKHVATYDLPVPPLAEQQEIVRQLDVMLAQVEQIKARLDAIPAILKKFRQSVLADAVSGKLTEEWREQEKIKPQIKELQDLKDSLIKSKDIKKDLEVIGAETLFEIPENWGNLALQSFASKITDGEHSTPKRESAGHYLLSARNVRDGYIDVSNVDYVGIEEFSKLRKRCDPNKGDVLISCSGSVGRIALVDKDDEYVMVRSAALVKTLDSFIDNKFLMYVLQSPYLQKQIDEKSKSTAQSNLFLGQIKELSIPYPSLKEQKEIVQQVESLFKNASLIETAVQSAQKRVNLLTQSILAKAFSGELTAEWREQHQDLITGVNSAEALLVKIQADREESKPVKKAKKAKAV